MPEKNSKKPEPPAYHYTTPEELSIVETSLAKLDKVDDIGLDPELKRKRVLQELEHKERRLKVELEELRLNQKLKWRVALIVFGLLAVETAGLFWLLYIHGVSNNNFQIDAAIVNIFVPATLAQISAMAIIITKYLFGKS